MTPTQQKHYDNAIRVTKQGKAAIERLTEDCQKNLQTIKDLQREEDRLKTKIRAHEQRPDTPQNIEKKTRDIMQQIQHTKNSTREYIEQYNIRENNNKDIQEHYQFIATEISAQQSAQQYLIDAWKNPTDDSSWTYSRKKYPNNESWHAHITFLMSFVIGSIKLRAKKAKETSPQ